MENTEFKHKLVSINRITKVVKGGRRFAFSALVVVGNFSGSIGVGHAKAKQVPDAIKKALEKKITNVYFDRGGYKFHGRIKSLAEAIRKGGLRF